MYLTYEGLTHLIIAFFFEFSIKLYLTYEGLTLSLSPRKIDFLFILLLLYLTYEGLTQYDRNSSERLEKLNVVPWLWEILYQLNKTVFRVITLLVALFLVEKTILNIIIVIMFFGKSEAEKKIALGVAARNQYFERFSEKSTY